MIAGADGADSHRVASPTPPKDDLREAQSFCQPGGADEDGADDAASRVASPPSPRDDLRDARLSSYCSGLAGPEQLRTLLCAERHC